MACTHWQIIERTFSIIYRTNYIHDVNLQRTTGDDAQLKRKQKRKDMAKRFNANQPSCRSAHKISKRRMLGTSPNPSKATVCKNMLKS